MSARERRRTSGSALGLDSFVDIVMNVMGALFFMVIYTALQSAGLKGKITTPLASVAQTEPVLFECRSNTVYFPALHELAQRMAKDFQECLKAKETTLSSCLDRYDKGRIRNAFYSARPGLSLGSGGLRLGVSFEPVPGARGDTLVQIRDENSAFRRELARLDPHKHHVYFIVRADSFGVFHSARRTARQLGFHTGWEPFRMDTKLGTGGGGGPRTFGPEERF